MVEINAYFYNNTVVKIPRASYQKGISTHLHNPRYLIQQHKIVGCMSCQKGAMLMLL
jgi:hypothetical protein